MKAGKLSVVATPIGDPRDLTLRGLRILRESDVVVCEERGTASRLFAHYELAKPLLELNEHSVPEALAALVRRLEKGEHLALISDHGTPLIQDPGADLVRAAIDLGIPIDPIPGASSILAALVASGIPAARFRILGQLPAKREARQRA